MTTKEKQKLVEVLYDILGAVINVSPESNLDWINREIRDIFKEPHD